MAKFFEPVIRLWPTVVAFADEVGCPERSAREWVRIDSIPAPWFNAVSRAAAKRDPADFGRITVPHLADLAERRREHLTTDRDRASRSPAAA
jgi:hypothetical protein